MAGNAAATIAAPATCKNRLRLNMFIVVWNSSPTHTPWQGIYFDFPKRSTCGVAVQCLSSLISFFRFMQFPSGRNVSYFFSFAIRRQSMLNPVVFLIP